MNSEKVKEIKKALECCAKGLCGHSCPRFNKQCININCQDEMNGDVLTLINELESENERLKKENTTKTDTITDLLNKQEFYEKEHLKQFAERLKEKLKEVHKTNRMLLMPERDIVLSTIENCFQMTDETLKEFLNKGDDKK